MVGYNMGGQLLEAGGCHGGDDFEEDFEEAYGAQT